jgi:hypothetical protein
VVVSTGVSAAQMRFQIESDCSHALIKRGTEVMVEEHSASAGELCVYRPRGQTQCRFWANDLLLADALCVRPRGETRCLWTKDLIESKAAFEAEKGRSASVRRTPTAFYSSITLRTGIRRCRNTAKLTP